MPDHVKRSYRSDARAAAARRTREAIRDAAAVLFDENGYVATTVREIAEKADVAVRTVFNSYPGGKAQIFDDALDHALGGDDAPTPLSESPITRLAIEATDGSQVVHLLARGASELYERGSGLITTYLESAGADPHMRHHADLGAAEAAKIMRDVAQALDESGSLRADLTAQQAGDIMLALCAPQVHHLLCRRLGWTSRAYRTWLGQELERAVLRDA